jgi:FG-GAP repeat
MRLIPLAHLVLPVLALTFALELASAQVSLDHLLPPAIVQNSQSGYALAASGDWLAVGARFDPALAPGAGAVDLYERTLLGFEHRGRLLASDGAAGDVFGFALNFAGDLLAVGAHGADVQVGTSTITNAGALYLFERSGASFAQVAKLTSPQAEPGERVGENVLLAGDWLFGAMHVGDDVPPAPGRGHVFRRTPTGFQFHQYLTSADAAAGDHFAYNFALAPGGDELFVSARNNDQGAVDAGSLYRFELEAGLWVERGEQYASNPTPGAYFSAALAFAGDTTLLVGAPGANTGVEAGGAVYVLERDPAGTWLETQILTPSVTVGGARFGTSVATAGNWLLVGAPFDAPAPPASTAPLAGALWLFERDPSGGFQERGRLVPGSFQNAPLPGAEGPAYFGSAVAISAPASAPVGQGLGFLAGGAPNAPSVGLRSGYTAVYAHPEARAVGLNSGPAAISLQQGALVGLELVGGGPANLAVDGGGPGNAAPSLAQALYLLLGSTQPPALGPSLDGIPLPLVPDAYTTLTLLQANQAPFQNTLGLLGPGASAQGAIAVPGGSNPNLAGLTLWHAALVFDWPGSLALLAVSAPRALLLTP